MEAVETLVVPGEMVRAAVPARLAHWAADLHSVAPQPRDPAVPAEWERLEAAPPGFVVERYRDAQEPERQTAPAPALDWEQVQVVLERELTVSEPDLAVRTGDRQIPPLLQQIE